MWSYKTDDMVLSSAAIADGLVYVGSQDNKVYALDALNGNLVWNYTTGGPVYSSPAVANGIVYVGSRDNKIYAFDASSGAVIWNYTTGGDVDSSPAVADGKVYLGSEDNHFYALDASSGAHIWSYKTDDMVGGHLHIWPKLVPTPDGHFWYDDRFRYTVDLEPWETVIFPAYYFHEASPVLQGRRTILISWAQIEKYMPRNCSHLRPHSTCVEL